MKFIKLTALYIKKRIFHILPYVVIPAIFLSLFTKPTNVFDFFLEIKNAPRMSFATILFTVTEISWGAIWKLALVSFVSSISIASLGGLIEKDMRLGQLTHRRIIKNANNNFIPILFTMIVFLTLLGIYGIVTASFIFLWSRVFNSITLMAVFIIVTAVILALLLVIVYAFIMLLVPHLIITGSRLHTAFLDSISHSKNHIFKLLTALILPPIPVAILFYLQSAFFYTRWRYLLNFVVYAMLLIYYFVLLFVAYFDIFQIERNDTNEKWRPGR